VAPTDAYLAAAPPPPRLPRPDRYGLNRVEVHQAPHSAESDSAILTVTIAQGVTGA